MLNNASMSVSLPSQYGDRATTDVSTFKVLFKKNMSQANSAAIPQSSSKRERDDTEVDRVNLIYDSQVRQKIDHATVTLSAASQVGRPVSVPKGY
jgi:hypothetical protein